MSGKNRRADRWRAEIWGIFEHWPPDAVPAVGQGHSASGRTDTVQSGKYFLFKNVFLNRFMRY